MEWMPSTFNGGSGMNLASFFTAVVMCFNVASASAKNIWNTYVNEAVENLYVYCYVDATSVSLDEIVPYTEVEFEGDNCAEIFVKLLEMEGLTPVYSGTTEEWFYLSSVEGIDTSEAVVSEVSKNYLIENSIDWTDRVSVEGCLGEFDFTDSSGWIFTVNGELPSCGMCDYVPQEGDEIRLTFTLDYGEDLDQ